MFTYSFEKLEVWKESKNFTKLIYLTTSNFPESEKYGLVSQLRRASVSVCSNIAEGTSRQTNKDKAHFSTMAFSSAVEILNQLIICFELNFITEIEYFQLRSDLESITNKLNALRNYQTNKSTETIK
jgi:four helix bundle protein